MDQATVGVSCHGGDGGVVDSRQPSPPPPQPLQSQISTLPHLLAGGIAGAFSKTCTAPLTRLTILFQTGGQGMHYSDHVLMSKPSIRNEAMRIIKDEGFRAFWKGNLAAVAHRLPSSAISFYAQEQYNTLLKSIPGLNTSSSDHDHGGNPNTFISGGLAGITSASATYPLDLVRTRLAVQTNTIYYRGIWHALSSIARDEGFLGLYKGLGATLLSVGPSLAISFSVYQRFKSLWHSKRPDDSTIAVSLACGSLAGIASSTATYPLDLVRRRMQSEGVVVGRGAGAYKHNTAGLFGTFGSIIKSQSVRGLYRGILSECYKVVPSAGIVFMTYETLKKFLSAETF